MALDSSVEDEQQYSRGSLLEIRLKNFLTYSDCKFRFGPKMNLVAGPNGSGKSSIVCAVCLGLAGSPSVLGRAKQIKDFIKHGQMEAIVEITLFNPPPNTVIKSVFKQNSDMQGSTSNWFINGTQSSKKKVAELVKSFNIQVDNLCQFLPQDKVVEFARLSNEDLLKETEKTINPELYQKHQKLLNFRSGEDNQMKEINKREEYLKDLESKNQVLHQRVQRYREREKHQDKLRLLKIKRCWVEYNNQRMKYFHSKKELQKLEDELKALRESHTPQINAINKLREKRTNLKSKVDEQSTDIKNDQNKIRACKSDNYKLIKKAENLRNNFKLKVAQEQERATRIDDLKRKLASVQDELKCFPPMQELEQEIAQKSSEFRQLETSRRMLVSEKEMAEERCRDIATEIKDIETDLNKANDVKTARLDIVRGYSKDTYQAAKWLNENKNERQFKNPTEIWGPIAVEINVRDQRCAKYVENHIALRDMMAFVFSNSDDSKTFLQEVRDKQKLNVNAIVPNGQPMDQYKPIHSIDNIRYFEYCITDSVQLVVTPIKKIVSDLKIDDFYVANDHHVCRRSRYGQREISTRITAIRDARYLNINVDTEHVEALNNRRSELQEQVRSVQSEIANIKENLKPIEAEIATINQSKKIMENRKSRIVVLETKINGYRKSIEQEEAVYFDKDEEENKLFKNLKNKDKEKLEVTKRMASIVEQYVDRVKKNVIDLVKLLDINREYEYYSEILARAEKEAENVIEQRARKMKETQVLKDAAKNALNVAKKESNVGQKENLPRELQERLSLEPDDIEEINEKIQAEKSKLQLNTQDDASVVDEYEKNNSAITALTDEISKMKGKICAEKDKVKECIDSWTTGIKHMTAGINQKFQHFFNKLNCVGEIKLRTNKDKDFSKFAIEIWVKFRSTDKVQLLDSHLQSGGERSVATIIYLISLQEFTICPFRIVDEINQGMDPQNEKRIFEFVLEVSSNSKVSQYLLITPKLLPNLCYDGKLTALFIYNGPNMLDQQQWNLKRFIGKKHIEGKK
ncbi:Structural maintenance of chromosomes protein 5 [Trichoplax sp. H2]|nr:Structural maintenance of chromosomes protein 5 [Trichoplax sp. H2]|eukprot:RDD45130.1 Structural maintenance of chromosomes protein 5 [Trichoplax sp. H2]